MLRVAAANLTVGRQEVQQQLVELGQLTIKLELSWAELHYHNGMLCRQLRQLLSSFVSHSINGLLGDHNHREKKRERVKLVAVS